MEGGENPHHQYAGKLSFQTAMVSVLYCRRKRSNVARSRIIFLSNRIALSYE